jgi:hypothetical protein
MEPYVSVFGLTMVALLQVPVGCRQAELVHFQKLCFGVGKQALYTARSVYFDDRRTRFDDAGFEAGRVPVPPTYIP